MSEPSLALLEQVLNEQREMRSEMRVMNAKLDDATRISIISAELGRRVERGIAELRSDFETMLTSELRGRLIFHERDRDARVDAIEARVAALESGGPSGS